MENFMLNCAVRTDLPRWFTTLSGIDDVEPEPNEDAEGFPYNYGARIGRAINHRYELIEEKIGAWRRSI